MRVSKYTAKRNKKTLKELKKKSDSSPRSIRWRFNFWKIGIDFDTNYGINKRKGWSISYNGSYKSQLEKYLVVAIYKAIKST